jgi:N-glycosylase/DNA lyase
MKTRLLLEYLISSLSSDMRTSCLEAPNFAEERRPEEIWRQKVFCVLSSQFNAQRASAITNNILQSIPFFDYSMPLNEIEEACFEFLSSGDIGYRFPKTRARQISLCWFPFSQIKDEYHEYVRSCGSEEDARTQITETFPGIGIKQASMFLRNIGACKNLSVIDVHVLFYLRVCHQWEARQLTPNRYLQAEDILRTDASRHGLDLSVFDVIVWSAAKALKRAHTNV